RLATVRQRRHRNTKEQGPMINWLLRRQIAAFERTWNYDAAYLHEMLAADPRALMLFGKVQALSRYRKDVPAPAYCAAGIVAVMKEDCGPCTQLAIDMAESGGGVACDARGGRG